MQVLTHSAAFGGDFRGCAPSCFAGGRSVLVTSLRTLWVPVPAIWGEKCSLFFVGNAAWTLHLSRANCHADVLLEVFAIGITVRSA